MDLITHTDLDGVASAYFIKKHVQIDNIYFKQPNQIREMRIPENEFIIADLPHHEKASLWFDHHASSKPPGEYEGLYDPKAPSAAQVICDYYKDYSEPETLAEINKADTASFSLKELKKPKDWALLYYTLDTTNNEEFLKIVIEEFKNGINGIKENIIIKEKMDRKLDELKEGDEYLKKESELDGRVLVCDFRDSGLSYSANRVFAIYPEIDYAILLKRKESKTAFSIRANSIKRDNTVNLGEILKPFGGGGHANACGALVEDDKVEKIIQTIANKVN